MSAVQGLIDQDKISQIYGNSTIDAAHVVLLSDSNHFDKTQKLIRGIAANALKGPVNVFLCEADSDTYAFLPSEIARYFPPNLQRNGSRDYLSGWDDGALLNETNQCIIQCLKHMKQLKSLGDFDRRVKIACAKNLARMKELGHLRTERLWKIIQKKRKAFPDAKIIVFGGQGHLSEKWLHDQLTAHEIPFVEITFADQEPRLSTEEMINQTNLDQYSPWIKKKQ